MNYKYYLRYRLSGYNGTTYGEVEILADDREDATEQANRWMIKEIIEGNVILEGGRWAILMNSKMHIVKTMYGNSTMRYFWK